MSDNQNLVVIEGDNHAGLRISIPPKYPKIRKQWGKFLNKEVYITQPKNNDADFRLGYDALPADYPKRRGENEFEISANKGYQDSDISKLNSYEIGTLNAVYCSNGDVILEVKSGGNLTYYKYNEEAYVKVSALPEDSFEYCDIAEQKFIGHLKDDYPQNMVQFGKGLGNQKVCGLYDDNGLVDNAERISHGLSGIKPCLLVGIRNAKLFIVTDNKTIEHIIGFGYKLESVSMLGDECLVIQLNPTLVKSFFSKKNHYIYFDIKKGSIVKQEYGAQSGWRIGVIGDKPYILPYFTEGRVDKKYAENIGDAML